MIHPFDVANEETRKSNLLLQAAWLRDRGDLEQASALFATAAQIEEWLATEAEAWHDSAHALRAWYSAASAWAHAGDFHHALTPMRSLEVRPDMPAGLRARIQAFLEQVSDSGNTGVRRCESLPPPEGQRFVVRGSGQRTL